MNFNEFEGEVLKNSLGIGTREMFCKHVGRC